MTARLRDGLLTLVTYILVLALFFPIFWTVLAGFKTEGTAVAQPPVLFFTPTFDNFREALTNAGYTGFFVNSVIISVCSTLVAFLLGIPAAFALGLFPTEKSAGTLSWVLSTKMMPAVGVIIPLIIIFKQIHLFDSIPGMIILYTSINLPLVIWMMRSFFAEIPKDLIEAARVDGAQTLQIVARKGVVLGAEGYVFELERRGGMGGRAEAGVDPAFECDNEDRLDDGRGQVNFWSFEVFAARPFGGNPAAVMVLPSYPDDATLQGLAQENNLAEPFCTWRVKRR